MKKHTISFSWYSIYYLQLSEHFTEIDWLYSYFLKLQINEPHLRKSAYAACKYSLPVIIGYFLNYKAFNLLVSSILIYQSNPIQAHNYLYHLTMFLNKFIIYGQVILDNKFIYIKKCIIILLYASQIHSHCFNITILLFIIFFNLIVTIPTQCPKFSILCNHCWITCYMGYHYQMSRRYNVVNSHQIFFCKLGTTTFTMSNVVIKFILSNHTFFYFIFRCMFTHKFTFHFISLVAPTGFEPVYQVLETCVLTTRRWGHIFN